MNTEHYLAAFDVGGTKTYAVLFKEDGTVVRHLVRDGGVPLIDGIAECEEKYGAVLKDLIEGYSVDVLYGSVATTEYFDDGREVIRYLKEVLPIKKIRAEGDGLCMISGVFGHADGASLVCGTGSALFIRMGESYHHIGGWGHLIDSCGSGYVLGREALRAAYRAHDHRGEETDLPKYLEKIAGRPIWDDLVTIYQKGRPYIASFARCVFEARAAGDAVARKIFNTCASDLADLVWAARREFGRPFDLVLNGGIFFNYPEYAEAVRAMAPKDVHVIQSDTPPIYGCAVEAMHDLGRSCDEAFRENFMRTYQ